MIQDFGFNLMFFVLPCMLLPLSLIGSWVWEREQNRSSEQHFFEVLSPAPIGAASANIKPNRLTPIYLPGLTRLLITDTSSSKSAER